MNRRNNMHRGMKACGHTGFGAELESLESRQMFSFSGADFYTVALSSGTELVCQMTASSEGLSVVRSPNGIQFNVNGAVDNIVGKFVYVSVLEGAGNNTVVIGPNMTIGSCVWAGSGNDLISTGASNTSLRAGSGNDTLVAIGGINDKLYAGAGNTEMWSTYDNYYYTGTGTLETHFFQSFLNTNDTQLNGQPIAEPNTNTATPFNGSWQNFGWNPLFSSAGPLQTDIVQGAVGDCYFVSALSSIARADPSHINDLITPLGDGTFAEEFSYGGKAKYIRVDGYLPVNSDGTLFYSGLGAQGSTWVALMEKGWAYMDAYENNAAPDYYYPDQGGTALIALGALGGQSVQTPGANLFGGNAGTFAGWINWQLDQGKAVDIGFGNKIDGILEDDHEYSVVSTTFSNGTISGFWVRNPWGVDFQNSNGDLVMASAGHNDGQNDGFVWVSSSMAFSDFNDLGSAAV